MHSEFQNLIGIEHAPEDIAVMRPNDSRTGRRRGTLSKDGLKTPARPRIRPVGRTEVYGFTPEQVQAIIQILRDKPRDLALFLIGINTGLRAQDLARLAWEDVIRHGEISGKARLWNYRKQIYEDLKIWSFGADPREALRKWQKLTKDSDLIFPGRKGECISIHQMDKLVKDWTAQAGVKERPYGTHSLRKTHGQFLNSIGYDETALRRMFKMSSSNYTSWYFRV